MVFLLVKSLVASLPDVWHDPNVMRRMVLTLFTIGIGICMGTGVQWMLRKRMGEGFIHGGIRENVDVVGVALLLFLLVLGGSVILSPEMWYSPNAYERMMLGLALFTIGVGSGIGMKMRQTLREDERFVGSEIKGKGGSVAEAVMTWLQVLFGLTILSVILAICSEGIEGAKGTVGILTRGAMIQQGLVVKIPDVSIKSATVLFTLDVLGCAGMTLWGGLLLFLFLVVACLTAWCDM